MPVIGHSLRVNPLEALLPGPLENFAGNKGTDGNNLNQWILSWYMPSNVEFVYTVDPDTGVEIYTSGIQVKAGRIEAETAAQWQVISVSDLSYDSVWNCCYFEYYNMGISFVVHRFRAFNKYGPGPVTRFVTTGT
jgi:hypothetical protein